MSASQKIAICIMFTALKLLGKKKARSSNFNRTTSQLKPYASHGPTSTNDDESAFIVNIL